MLSFQGNVNVTITSFRSAEEDAVTRKPTDSAQSRVFSTDRIELILRVESRPKVVGVNCQTPCHSCERLWNPANSWSQCHKGESIGTVLRFHLKSMEAQAKLGEASRTEGTDHVNRLKTKSILVCCAKRDFLVLLLTSKIDASVFVCVQLSSYK